jgi:hypothetical protein
MKYYLYIKYNDFEGFDCEIEAQSKEEAMKRFIAIINYGNTQSTNN